MNGFLVDKLHIGSIDFTAHKNNDKTRQIGLQDVKILALPEAKDLSQKFSCGSPGLHMQQYRPDTYKSKGPASHSFVKCSY